jgi:hypothetical protein
MTIRRATRAPPIIEMRKSGSRKNNASEAFDHPLHGIGLFKVGVRVDDQA